MEDYQLRHDIDRLRRFLDELEILYNDKLGETDGKTLKDVFDMYYDQSEVESKSAVLKDSLKTLSESLVAFNQSLITFNGDTEALADDLTSLSTNLDNFLGDLSGLGESLELFDAQLNGGTYGNTTYRGFLTDLNSLENYMYGKGQTYNGQPCSYQNPHPDSLKGKLLTLWNDLEVVDGSDRQLSISLEALSGSLDAFGGTLQEFDALLQRDLEPEIYSKLNEYMIQLFYAIASSKSTIATHQRDIDKVQEDLGNPNSEDESTVFGKINGADSRIGAVEDSAEGLTKTLYAGNDENYDPNADAEHPANETVIKYLNTVKDTDIPNIQGELYGEGDAQNYDEDSVMGRIDKVQEDIGNEHTEGSLKYQIIDIDDKINNEQNGVIKQIEDVNNAYTGLGNNLSNVESHLYVGTSSGANGTTADPYDGTIMRRLLDEEYLTYYIDLALTKMYDPSVIFSRAVVLNEQPTQSIVNNIQTQYNLNISLCFYDGDFYVERNNGWVSTSDSNVPSPILGLLIDNSPIVPVDGENYSNRQVNMFDYFYVIDTKQYFETADPINVPEGMVGIYGSFKELSTAPQLFQHTQLYDAIAECFSPIGHTHSASEIMAHTHTIANITNLQSTLDSKANASTTYTKTEVNDALSSKANRSHTHTISNITNLQTTLNNKAEKSSTYTKTQVDTALSSKADSSDTYTKTEVDTALSSKANASTTYTKTEVNNALNGKADKEWDVLYDGGMGTVRTDGNLVSVRITTGSTAISPTDWTTMGELSRLGGGIPSQYYPQSNVYSPYLNGITVLINTNGEIKATRPAGQVTGNVEINVVYPVW